MASLNERSVERVTLDRQFLLKEKADVIIKEISPAGKASNTAHKRPGPREMLI